MRSIIFVSILSLPIIASAGNGTGSGGIAECLNLSLNAALEKYSESKSVVGVPAVQIESNEKSYQCSPTNGMDLVVTVNGTKMCVVASGVSTPDHTKLLGCLDATVMSLLK